MTMIQAFLIFTNGARMGEKIALDPHEKVMIGRGPDNTIVLNEKKVSRHHAVLQLNDNGDTVLQDLKSTNGVYVNDIKVDGETQIRSGDKIQVGRNLFSFIVDEVHEQSEAKEAAEQVLQASTTEIHEANAQDRECVLSGRIEELGIADILQTLHRNKKSGRLLFTQGDRESKKEIGFIEIRDGEVVYAKVDGVYAEKALYRLLRLMKGRFTLIAIPPDGFSNGEGIIRDAATIERLLLEGFRQMDELRTFETLFSDGSLQFDINKDNMMPLSDLNPEILVVFQCILSQQSLSRILDNSPLSDVETLKVLKQLLEKQFIKKVG